MNCQYCGLQVRDLCSCSKQKILERIKPNCVICKKDTTKLTTGTLNRPYTEDELIKNHNLRGNFCGNCSAKADRKVHLTDELCTTG